MCQSGTGSIRDGPGNPRDGAGAKVKSVLHMELFLNLAWLLLAGTIVGLWLRGEVRAKTGYGQQLIAIAVLIAILFPVISMSDDLLTVQNAFEADNYQRRNHLGPYDNPHVQSAVTILAALVSAGSRPGLLPFPLPCLLPVCRRDSLELPSIGKRPPPTA